MHLLSFLDAHSGSIQAITAVILVIVTAIYTILTRSMAKAAREALRAYVYLDLSFLSVAQMVIVVGNSGNKVAGKVTVALIGSNSEKLAALVRELPLTAGIGHLSPGSTRRYLVGVNSADLLPKGAPAAKFDFEITYHNGARMVTDRQSFDLEGYRSALVSGYGDPLTEIVTQLREIAQNMPHATPSFPLLLVRHALTAAQ
jgi:hypothetical protein